MSGHAGGGVASVPTWVRSHGLYSVRHIGIFQDPATGEIRQQRPGVPSSVSDVIVPADRNPSTKAFAVVGWNQGALSSNPLVEIRVYYLNKEGAIFERCFSANGGPHAEWYDGALTGQFKAAPYSGIAANVSTTSESASHPDVFRVYYQEPKTNHIRELLKEDSDTFAPFRLVEPHKKKSPAGIEGTHIATNTAFSVNPAGHPEIYYQIMSPTLKWHIDGAGAQKTFTPHNEFPYDSKASISVSGSVAQENAIVVTVNQTHKIIVTVYNKETKKWNASSELITVVGNRQIWISNHPEQQMSPHPHRTTIAASQDVDNPGNITLVRFKDASVDGWGILQQE